MKAIILAAGEGTRLKPLTLDIPKSLISIGGKPIIDRIFESLPDEIDEVFIVVGHLKEKIKSHLGDNFRGKKVSYANQIDKHGTFGALLSARSFLSEGEVFLVLNGDDIHRKEELQKFMSGMRSFGVQKMIMPNYYSVLVNDDDHIEGFRSQTEEEKKSGTLVATGVYTLDTKIFDHPGVVVNGGEYGLPQTILAQKDLYPVKAILTTSWFPINSFEDIEKFKTNFPT